MAMSKPEAAAVVANHWGVFAAFVAPCYYFTAGPVNKGTLSCIFRPVRSWFVDGSTVQVGDSEVLVPTVEMEAVPMPPVAGVDYLLDLGGVHRWNVITGQALACQVLTRLIVRRVY